MIRNIESKDVEQICEIYNHYVENAVCTFEVEPVTVDEMTKRIENVTGVYPWIVAEEEGLIIGYAYAGRWKEREAYRFTVETSVYIRFGYVGRRIGSTIYTSLIRRLRSQGIHAVIGGVVLPNEKSERLHERLGFEKIGHFAEVGFKFDSWRDVGYFELILK
ncbi:MAG: N-acetyltransferase family protein [Clostridia bacterium]|nr:N-acetyltransferase family protein [Clostridia bacterium]